MLEGGDGVVDLEAAQALTVDVDDFVAYAQPPVPGGEREGRKLNNNASNEVGEFVSRGGGKRRLSGE